MQGVTEGRIVHYVVGNGTHRAAIIVKNNDSPDGMVNLLVMLNGTRDTSTDTGMMHNGFHAFAESVLFDDDAKAVNTWHWIEKA